MSDVDNIGQKYRRVASSPESLQLIKEGKGSEVNTKLRALVADIDKTAVDYFILANMLYRADIRVSYAYIKKADALSPQNPYILFEYAMQEHRAGNCKAALPMYEQSSDLSNTIHNPTLWAYVAHCRLVLGDYKGAMQAWKQVDFRQHHTAIETSMYEIFSLSDPESERENLMAAITSGSSDGVCKLIKLDKNWERDWWNVIKNKEYLEYDLKWLRNLANYNPGINVALRLCNDSVEMSNKEFRSYIAASGFWGNNYILPQEPTVTYRLISELGERNIATPAEILERYEMQLVNRHKQLPQDKPTLDVLAFLYNATNQSDKLTQLDLYGWKHLKIEEYAQSYLQRIPPTAPEYQQTVEQAAVDFPNSVPIQYANLLAHAQAKDKPVYLMKYVAAQFSNVRNHLSGPFRLNDYMASLEHEISKLNNASR